MKIKLCHVTENSEQLIERIGRECYNSKDKICEGSHEQFIKNLIKRGHTSVLEHANATFYFAEVSRAFSHQLVRQRIASPTQKSQRYCREHQFDYTIPESISKNLSSKVKYNQLMMRIQETYDSLVKEGVPPQDARFVLPNACHTSLFFTANFREWRHIIELRCEKSAQWEIRYVMIEVLKKLFDSAPSCFIDLYDKYICDE